VYGLAQLNVKLQLHDLEKYEYEYNKGITGMNWNSHCPFNLNDLSGF
jgi:hypothetical protein